MTEVRVPTLGESVTEATVATWFKKPGDTVAQDEMLCELETDKVTVEVPAPAAGTLSEIVAGEGDTVGVDALLAQISAGGEANAPAKAEKAAPAAAEAPAASGGDEIDVMVPTLGESVTEATVSNWFKKPGEAFEADEMLCELETDKVSVEVPAPAAGVMTKLLAEEGSTVEAGGKLAIMSTDTKAPATALANNAPETSTAPASQGGDAGKDVEDAPSAKKLMAENNLSSGDVAGSGKDGRVMKEDVLKALEGGAKPAPAAAAPRAPVAADQARHADHLQRGRHDRGDGPAQRVQRPVFEKARCETGLHVLLHQGLRARPERSARSQRRDRRHGHRLQELRQHGHRRRHPHRSCGAGDQRRRSNVVRHY